MRSPKEEGRSLRSLKLLLRFRYSRFVSKTKESGRPCSSLKWASRYVRDLISPMLLGNDRILLYCIMSFSRFTSSEPMLVGK